MSDNIFFKIQEGLWWNVDGHDFTVKSVDRQFAIVEEKWINEDTFRTKKDTRAWKICEDGVSEYIHPKKHEDYRLYASSAFNISLDTGKLTGSETVYEEAFPEEDEEDDRWASSTNRDYGPLNPWDAPGMSISDFI